MTQDMNEKCVCENLQNDCSAGVKSKRNRVMAVVLSMALILCMAVPASAAYETTINSFECRGLSIPAYSGKPYAVINNNQTTFSAAEKAGRSAYEVYSPLDSKGRVGTVSANIDKSSLPDSPRGDISQIYPTGWKQNKYSEDLVEKGWLYNRSHLYAYSLGGDDIRENLCTGCRAFNYDGMCKAAEESVLDHVRKSNEHVLYRVTPVFFGNEMLARGVLIEAESLESEAINICVFCYNAQPGIAIDYQTGENKAVEDKYKTSVGTVKISKIGSKVYTGRAFKPLVYATDANGYYLKFGRDFSVSYSSNVYPGKATVRINGEGNYTGSRNEFFYILPARAKITAVSAAKKSIKIRWKKQPKVSGYQIRYRAVNSKKTVTLNVGSASSMKKIKHLKSKKKYSVQVKAYKMADGKKLYGDYSIAKKVRVK